MRESTPAARKNQFLESIIVAIPFPLHTPNAYSRCGKGRGHRSRWRASPSPFVRSLYNGPLGHRAIGPVNQPTRAASGVTPTINRKLKVVPLYYYTTPDSDSIEERWRDGAAFPFEMDQREEGVIREQRGCEESGQVAIVAMLGNKLTYPYHAISLRILFISVRP